MTLVFLTGAGISTESGIPDYRGPDGEWTRNPEAERLVTLDYYVADPEIRRRSWLFRRDSAAWTAEPNAAHRAIAACTGAWVITQNIDRLHHRAGSDPHRVIELHGSMFGVVCLACGDRTTTRAALDRVAAGEADPPCRVCGGLLKTETVMFGEQLDQGVLDRAVMLSTVADTFVVVGTSLQVHPAASLAGIAARHGARVLIVNAEPTPYDDRADEVIRGRISEAVPELCRREGWVAQG